MEDYVPGDEGMVSVRAGSSSSCGQLSNSAVVWSCERFCHLCAYVGHLDDWGDHDTKEQNEGDQISWKVDLRRLASFHIRG